ncbi:hypothetical protein SDC9_201037 [bioreactor metagenome]|uniref:Uncharacterized protein n=1 Tax=bioreactor metagenome TaxID=1076179 RepID=A0A645J1P5_9ZZZZ
MHIQVELIQVEVTEIIKISQVLEAITITVEDTQLICIQMDAHILAVVQIAVLEEELQLYKIMKNNKNNQ